MPISRRRKRAEEDKKPESQSRLCRIMEAAIGNTLGSVLFWVLTSPFGLLAFIYFVFFAGSPDLAVPQPIAPIEPPIPEVEERRDIASTPGFEESSGTKVFGKQLPPAEATVVFDAYGKCLSKNFDVPYDFIYNYYHSCLSLALGEERTPDGMSFDDSTGEPLIKRMYKTHLSEEFKNLFKNDNLSDDDGFYNYSKGWIKYSSLSSIDINPVHPGGTQFRVSFNAHLLEDFAKTQKFSKCFQISGESSSYMIHPLTCPN